jgi:hypothetical protein
MRAYIAVAVNNSLAAQDHTDVKADRACKKAGRARTYCMYPARDSISIAIPTTIQDTCLNMLEQIPPVVAKASLYKYTPPFPGMYPMEYNE